MCLSFRWVVLLFFILGVPSTPSLHASSEEGLLLAFLKEFSKSNRISEVCSSQGTAEINSALAPFAPQEAGCLEGYC